jgi:hemerythrin-like domain-containing protein
MTLVQIGGKRGDGPTFEQPFEMMEACHERLHRMLALLERLRTHLPEHGADDQARQAARDVMKYFDQAAPQHHRDEELHVFPPLLAQGDAPTLATVRQLQDDHAQMEVRWVDAREILAGVDRADIVLLTEEQEEALDAFASLYAAHIDAEERVAYPAVRALLDEKTVRAMGAEMAQRRNTLGSRS